MAAFELSGFISSYSDFARAYLFECKIDGFDPGDHDFLVKSTKLPETNIAEITTDWQGNLYKIGGTTEFADFTISFNMDDKGALRKSFIKWCKDVHDPETNIHGAPTSYFKDITLKHLDGKGSPTLTYKLIQSWPKSVGEVALDYSTKEVATFDVTFAYQYHTAS